MTGTGGAGKSSLIDEIVVRYLADFPDRTIGIVSVDPSRRRSGGALLGDRIRMNSATNPRVFMRSLATRQANLALSPHVASAVDLVKVAGYDLVILETSGIGQADTEIVDHADLTLYVMTPEYGAASQLEKVDMLDYADLVVVNKSDRRGADDAVRDVRKQYRRNHTAFEVAERRPPDLRNRRVPLQRRRHEPLLPRAHEGESNNAAEGRFVSTIDLPHDHGGEQPVIPKDRVRYLSEIATQSEPTTTRPPVRRPLPPMRRRSPSWPNAQATRHLTEPLAKRRKNLILRAARVLDGWESLEADAYSADSVTYDVRGTDIEVETATTTLSGTRIPKVALPRFTGWGDRVRWGLQENLPGRFPIHRRCLSRSNAPPRIRRGCSRGRAVPSRPTAVSTTSLVTCRPSGSLPHSTP